jgi:type 1 glutamine amidotransferase
MPTIDYRAPIKVLAAVRGHPFDRNAFDAMFLGMTGITATMVDQPAAAQLMNPAGMAPYQALVLYDMPGLDFAEPDDPPSYVAPDAAFKSGFRALLEQGIGIVALHHALAGWPLWPEYGNWLGGRFLYHPGEVRGARCLDSGYAHSVTYEARVLSEHPITEGLPAVFPITDEPYLAEIFEHEVSPLVASSAAFTRDHFWSADAAVRGRMNCRDGWDHPPGSNLIAWSKWALASPLVYLQPGDGPSAFENPHYRRLLENAIRWVVTQAPQYEPIRI